MTPAELKAARAEMRFSARGLAEALGIVKPDGRGDDRRVRRWEAGDDLITPMVESGIRRQLAEWRRAQDHVAARVVPRLDAAIAERGPPQSICLATYRSDEDIRRLAPDEPHLTLSLHRHICRAMAAAAAERHILIDLVEIAPEKYFKWLGRKKNDADSRAAYAAAHPSPPVRRLSITLGVGTIGWALQDVPNPGSPCDSE